MRRLLVPVALVLFGAVVAAVAANVVRDLDATWLRDASPVAPALGRLG